MDIIHSSTSHQDDNKVKEQGRTMDLKQFLVQLFPFLQWLRVRIEAHTQRVMTRDACEMMERSRKERKERRTATSDDEDGTEDVGIEEADLRFRRAI